MVRIALFQTASGPRIFCAAGRYWLARVLLVGLLWPFWAGVPRASTDPAAAQPPDLAAICEAAATEAARASGVPISVLKAISLTETGRKRAGAFRPWPWTVNMEGKGVWFDTEDEARAYVYDHYKRGARSFDVGCFQINYRWHGEAFASIDEMFDPMANALYAANFLLELFAESGSWETAAGAYHSRTPMYADRYKARFNDIRSRFAAEDGQPLPELAQALMVGSAAPEALILRVNNFPLLKAGTAGAMGSLFSPSAMAGSSLVTASASQLFGPTGTEN